MTRLGPARTCVDLVFRERHAVGGGGEVALEDYARALTQAEGAEAIPAPDDPGLVTGLHLCAPAIPARGAVAEDIEAFASEMSAPPRDGLGWS